MKKFFLSTPIRRAVTAGAAILLAFAVVCGMLTPLLIYGEDKIISQAVSNVFPTATDFREKHKSYDNEVESLYAVLTDETVAGYLYNVNANGISGQINFYVGLDMTGRVIGIYFPYLDEPVSYGDMTDFNSFIASFTGRTGPFAGVEGAATLSSDISLVGGAHNTCFAVIDGVNAATEAFFNDELAEEAE